MKNHNCRMTPAQRDQHDRAVKIRKMTDAQICGLVKRIQDNTECVKAIEIGKNFVCDFVNGIKPEDGFGKGTIEKIRKYAHEKGYFDREADHEPNKN